jgi:hypothetical protein
MELVAGAVVAGFDVVVVAGFDVVVVVVVVVVLRVAVVVECVATFAAAWGFLFFLVAAPMIPAMTKNATIPTITHLRVLH